jgi:hypothetical protein
MGGETRLVTFGFCPVRQDESGSWQPDETAGVTEEQRHEPPLGWALSMHMRDRLDAYWQVCQANKDAKEIIAKELATQR